MGEVIKFESDNPCSWTVEDALTRALETVKSGKFDADCVYVAMGNSKGKTYYTMAGMQLPEVLGWLALHKHRLLASSED